MSAKPMPPAERAQQILDTLIKLSQTKTSYLFVTREDIAKEINISRSLISHYYSNVEGLHDELMRYALEKNIFVILGQGIVHRHPRLQGLPPQKVTKIMNEYKKGLLQ